MSKQTETEFFRCGWCGCPTDIDGEPLPPNECEKLNSEQLNTAELLHGYCCLAQQEKETIIVTRDMAIDAGDLSLEGQQWAW
jgi:hypothetical protein